MEKTKVEQIKAEHCTAEQLNHLNNNLFPTLREVKKKARARLALQGKK
jgi:hypothetical protein